VVNHAWTGYVDTSERIENSHTTTTTNGKGQTMTSASTHGSCVCVQSTAEDMAPRDDTQSESPDGSLCEVAHTHIDRTLVTTLTLTALHIASTSVSKTHKFASTLLVHLGVKYESA